MSETAENYAVGGKNRWSYESIEEWACYPSLENPVLVYFRENQTSSSGQGHLFPVLFDAEQLRQLMAERVGEAVHTLFRCNKQHAICYMLHV